MAVSDATHPTYRAHQAGWRTTRRMLTGEEVSQELVQRYFEHEDHFAQRREDSDFTPWSRYLMSRLAGMLFQRAEDVDRDIGPLSEEALETAGPKGEDYSVLLLQLAEKLLSYNTAVVVLNPARGLHVHTPLAMTHWGTDAEGAPFATITSSRVEVAGPAEKAESETTYVVYRPQRFDTYVERDGEDVRIEEESGTWAEEGEPFFVIDGQPVPPVLRIQMPWEAKLGLQVAKKHRAIYRMTSRRDFSVSAAMNGLIQLGVGDDIEYEDIIKEDAKSGEKFLPYSSDYGAHQGLQLPTEGAKLGTEVLDAKKEDLARIAYAEMEEGARSSTSATEAMIKERGAAAAALSVVAETMSDAEQRILSLMVQASDFRQFAGPNPSDPNVSASWPTDYSDVIGGDEESLAKAIFGSRLPADEETATQVLMDTFEEEGYSPEEAQLQEEVRSALGRSAQSSSLRREFIS